MTAVRDAAPVRRASLAGQIGRFAVIGALSTVLHLGLFALLVRAGTASQLANGSALVIATVANTAAANPNPRIESSPQKRCRAPESKRRARPRACARASPSCWRSAHGFQWSCARTQVQRAGCRQRRR